MTALKELCDIRPFATSVHLLVVSSKNSFFYGIQAGLSSTPYFSNVS
jgi:hypothetical protein